MPLLTEREAFRVLGAWQGIGPRQMEALLNRHGSALALVKVLGGSPGSGNDGQWVARCDPGYPAPLLDLDHPPMVMHYLGALDRLLEAPTVALVGTRRASAFALSLARELGRQLAESGVQVVSGLARGIDAAAHLGSLEAAGNPPGPVAVVGRGLDGCYPREHGPLMDKVARRGVVISEYRPGTPSFPHHFPDRNRIIAALSSTVVVIEAPLRSGALTTVHEALALGREVMAVPGRVGHLECAGSNRILQEGAGIVTCLADILDTLQTTAVRPLLQRTLKLDPWLERMGLETWPAETLCQALDAPIYEVQAWLVRQELEGQVRPCGDGRYQRRVILPLK